MQAEGEEDDDDEGEDDSEEGEDELDDDDLDLIHENTGVTVKRKQQKRFKRLRKKRRTDEAREETQPVAEEHIRVDREGAQDRLREQLFEDDDQDEAPEQQRRGAADIDFDRPDEVDEMEDFIVHDGPGERARPRVMDHDVGVPSRGALNAEEKELLATVFGQRDINFDDDDDDLDDDLDEEEKVDTLAAATKVFEPSAIKEHYLQEQDETIRTTDLPERLQVWQPGVFPQVGEGTTLEQEAHWMVHQFLSLIHI
eukprot:TRINITY_DN14612_c0_g1_i4.p2 TRINITY_DN14612_c0_g1~~TRINITY_DN14612_c0_g1_i4.p2  ORF type:complete len:255 (-),score=99.26 TRINITY_DN14612_c0_g1_i4:167-931(-)